MDERKLRDFFLGRISASRLARSIDRSVSHPDEITSVVYVRDMKEPFTVTREMAISLCDAVLHGELPPNQLQWVGFTLHASDSFDWNEDDLLSAIFEDWSSPEINLPLTTESVDRFKKWLSGEETYPDRPPAKEGSETELKLVTVTRKISSKFPRASAFFSRIVGRHKTRS
jgi:hypothetical protein